MRKFAKILIPAFLLIAVVMSMSILSVSAAPEEVTLEWTGSTQDEAVTFLNNAMAEAEAGKEVKVVLKANMSFTSSSALTRIDLGTDATTDTTVVISGEATGDTYYGIVLDGNTILNFKGNVTFKDVALTGTGAWSSGSTVLVSEGTGTFGANDAANGYGNVKASKVNVAGKDIKIYSGSYSTVAGNMYKSGVTIDSPTLVLAGNSSTSNVIGRQQELGGGELVTGDSNVSILDQASVTSEVTAGNRQANATKGGGTLTLNTTGNISKVYLAGSNTTQNGDFAKADGTRSTYTLNVLGGKVSGNIYLYASQTGTAKNLNAVFNFGNAEYNGMLWTGMNKLNDANWAAAVVDCDVEVNITGGTFASVFYAGSRFEYNSAKDKGSYEKINRTINISGNPTFKDIFIAGSYAKYGEDPHRGNTTINISGGTFKKAVYGASRLLTAAGGHTGNVDITVNGGTVETSFYGGAYAQFGATPCKGDINITITGGTFKSNVFGGSHMDVASAEHTGNTKLTIKGGTFNGHIYAGSYLRTDNSKHSGTSTLEIGGAMKHTSTSTRVGAGSIITKNAIHSGATNLILSSNATGSFATQILAGSYLDKGAHTGDANVVITGSADWKASIYGGSFVGDIANPVGTEADPITVNIVVEETYSGEITKLVASNMYNGTSPKNTTTYANANVTIKGGEVSSVYAHDVLYYAENKVVGETKIDVVGGTTLSVAAFSKLDNGAKVVINVADTAERVVAVRGSEDKSVTPANVFVTYDRSVTRDDEISGIKTENITANGNKADQPEVYMVTVFISANGTGDGSSPDKPLGNVAGYDPLALKIGSDGKPTTSSDAYLGNALYRAVEELAAMGGRIVLVGPVSIDTAASRVESSGKGQAPSEFTLPVAKGEIVITSVYNGVDYAKTNGAKLILDQDKCSVTFLEFNCPVTFDNVTLEHRYDPNDTNAWELPFAIAACGNKLVVESNVKVTAWNTAKNMEGNWYPMILGGKRYTDFDKSGNERPVVANPNVTIKAGNWSAVYAGCFGMGATYPGTVKGNATVNIMGGKIDTVYGTTDAKYASGKITGKLEINVTGGYVGAIFATQKNGAANEIVVNIAATAERVAKVWGGVSNASIPTNGTVNYDRSVTRDDEVMYWTTVNATGDVANQPDPVYFTIYVADVEKGLGDGSSPENAIGHGANYAQLRKQALALIKAANHDYSKLSKENQAIVGAVYKQNALYRALSANGGKLVKQGGKLVVCGTLTVDATDAMRKSLADFWGPTGSAEVIITSYDGTTNFRAKGAKLVLDTSELGLCVEFGSPTTLDNLTIVHKYNSKNGKGLSNGAIIAARGNKFVVGYNVNVVATDVNPDEDARVEMYPTLLGGHRYSDTKTDCYITVGSGQWAALVGGDWGSAHTGNATIGINGGKIGTVCGTTNPTNGNAKHIFDGSVWIGLWAGEVDNVYVVGKPGMIWGDASIGLGGTKINGKVRATHPDYAGDEIQSWVFNYTDKQVDTKKVVGFENPVPETGSALPYLAVVATVSLVGAAALIVSKKKKAVKN